MNCCCALLIGVSLTVGQTPTNENLKVLDPLIGEWEGTYTIAEIAEGASSPLPFEEGDELPLIVKYATTENGQAIRSYVALVIDGVETPMIGGFITWCPKSKKIVATDTNVSGGVGRYTVNIDGNMQWWKADFVGPDGVAGSATFEFAIKGDKMNCQIVDRVHDGKELRDSKKYVLERVDKRTSQADFEELCEACEGRWVGELTLVADAPGFGKKGEKLTSYGLDKVTQDGNAILCDFYCGEGSGIWFIIYDPRAKRTRTTWVTSGGGMDQAILYKRNGKWIEQGTGSKPDGSKIEFTNTLTISDDGRTHTWTGFGAVGGERRDDRHDVFRRVNK